MVDFAKLLEDLRGKQAAFAGDRDRQREAELVAELDRVQPSPTQRAAIDTLLSGRSVFLSGVAGTGKSWVVRRWLKELELAAVRDAIAARQDGKARPPRRVAITASTGIAALGIGGRTVHSWVGWRKGCSAGEIAAGYGWRDRVSPRIYAVDALLIDEVSMLGSQTFDLVDQLCRTARGRDVVFGGLQVVLVGDMGQLPPVSKADDEQGFPFESRAWRELDRAGMAYVNLTEPQRQADPRFVGLLNRARVGSLTPEDEHVLRSRMITPPAFQPPIKVVTKNAQADGENARRLAELPGAEHLYDADGYGPDKFLAKLAQDCLAPEHLRLKDGARVMFVVNDPKGQFVNGSLGTVVACHEDTVSVQVDNGDLVEDLGQWTWDVSETTERGHREVIAEWRQIPLRLAYAITVHKSQGQTLDAVELDLSEVFCEGQAYVALSRCRSLDSMYITGWCPASRVRMHPKVREWILAQEGIGRMLEGLDF